MQPEHVAEARSYTIKEFCAAEQISKFTYFKMREAGLGPREIRYGTVVRISQAARMDWQRERENPKGEEAKAIASRRAELRQRTTAAATKAVQSPRHVSARKRRRYAQRARQ